MQSHGNLLLRLYGQARGRASEYWGEKYLDSDRWVRTMGIPDHAEQWDAAQNPDFRNDLDAFAAGINDYVREHPDSIDDEVKVVLPITGADLLAHVQRVLHFTFMVDPEIVAELVEPEKLTVKRSLHGPIVAEKDGKAIALRVVGLDRSGVLQQWWDMARATNLAEFEEAENGVCARLALYADYLVAIADGSVFARGQPIEVMTEEIVGRVFGLECRIVTDPIAGTPMCIPVGRKVDRQRIPPKSLISQL
jgi:hypothetical protein